MAFKAEWEKTSTGIQLPQTTVMRMIKHSFPGNKLLICELIAGGCANLNFKIFLELEREPFILRVYLRDKSAAYREQNLGALLKSTIPVPLTHFTGEIDNYQFAITEFMQGITLRDFLLNNSSYDISGIMHEVGVTLSNITLYKFPKAGALSVGLDIVPETHSHSYISSVNENLNQEKILSLLSSQTISDIKFYFDRFSWLLQDNTSSHLVHGDFDPANILVNQIKGVWEISGILDWEFSFSGSVLWDVANMLRYAHKMPPEFQTSFLKGLKSRDLILPENWLINVYLLNLISLIDCLKRSNPEIHPARCADIYDLINFILSALNKML